MKTHEPGTVGLPQANEIERPTSKAVMHETIYAMCDFAEGSNAKSGFGTTTYTRPLPVHHVVKQGHCK